MKVELNFLLAELEMEGGRGTAELSYREVG